MEKHVRALKPHGVIQFMVTFNSSINIYLYKQGKLLYFYMEILNLSM